MKTRKKRDELYSVSSLQKALPWIFLFTGLASVSFGVWFPFVDGSKWKEFLKVVGGSVLSGGIFTYLVRYSQMMGIVKMELEDIIYDTRHLRTRKDLETIWERVSLEVFKNKFKQINKALLKDIKEQYLPTNHAAYYDEYKQWIDIEIIDESTLQLSVTNKCRFVVVPSSREKMKYEFQNILTFNSSQDELTYKSSYIKINGTEIRHSIDQTIEGRTLLSRIWIDLEGKDRYEIEREEIKTYSMKSDNIISFTPQYLTNSFECTISHPTSIKISLHNCGTLSSFRTLHETTKQGLKSHRFSYGSVLFPNQGYFRAITYLK